MKTFFYVGKSFGLLVVLLREGRQLLSILLHLRNSPYEFIGEHINEFAELISYTQKHITYIILPVRYRMLKVYIFTVCLIRHLSYLIELSQTPLVTLVNVVDFTFVNQTFNTSIFLLFFLPKIQRQAMALALSAFCLFCFINICFLIWGDFCALHFLFIQIVLVFLNLNKLSLNLDS